MNSVGRIPAYTSPNRCRISAQPFTRSVFAHFNAIPSFAYCAATVDPSLCRENTSAPATKRLIVEG